MPDHDEVGRYWKAHIHDLEITSIRLGRRSSSTISISITSRNCITCCGWSTSTAIAGKKVLEVGCGAGTDLARFAKGGAIVTGVDLVRRRRSRWRGRISPSRD